jgi:hypothetical protein
LPDLVSRVELACYAAAPPSDDEIATIRRTATAITLHPTQRPRLPEVPAGRR